MRAAIIFFTGTSNTEFIAKQFAKEFKSKGTECSLIDIRRKNKLNDNYDYFVFASPVYFEMFPQYFIDWISRNILNGNRRKCIVVSTQAHDAAAGPLELAKLLEERGFEVSIQDFIKMPNNYYIVGFDKLDEQSAIRLKEAAIERVEELVNKFINGEKVLMEVTEEGRELAKAPRTAFEEYTPNWARDNISLDYGLCVMCGKCAKNCPTRNIKMEEQITFKQNCISCQRCIHCCPVNAFLYRDRRIEQYRI